MVSTEWVILLVLVVFGVMVVRNLRSIDRHLVATENPIRAGAGLSIR